MRQFDNRIAAALCAVTLLVASGCSQPKSGTRFEPEITGRHGGLFSYDITFTLNAVNRVDWSSDDDNQVTNTTTPVGTETA